MKEKGDQVSDLLYPKLTELPYYYILAMLPSKPIAIPLEPPV